MTHVFKAMQPAPITRSAKGYDTIPAFQRNLTLADAQSALNRVRGIRLTAALLRHLPALAEVIERGGSALRPRSVLRDTGVSLAATGTGLQDHEAEAFAIVGVACTYGRATGQIGRGNSGRKLSLVIDDEGLHLAATDIGAAA